jgi:hypothetical protein
MPTLPEIADFIQRIGFPIFVALVLLFRVESMHVENLTAIHALTDAVWALTGRRQSAGGS